MGKKYYKLDSSYYVNYGLQKAPKLGEQSVMLGRPVDRTKLPSLVFEHNFPQGEPIPHYLTGGTVLASKLFIDLLDRIGVDTYQAFPALLVNPETGDEREDYFLFNVLGMMEVATVAESNFDEGMDDTPDGVGSPVTAGTDSARDDKPIRDVDMFRSATEPISILVSEHVVDALKNNRPDDGWGIVVEEIDAV